MEHEFEFFTDSYDSETDFPTEPGEERELKVRLDKWLWAARFFKTRALARAAVEQGKVFYNGERSKPSREIEIGALLQVRHGRFEKTVIVKGLSTRRRSTEEALSLFEETEDSRIAREQAAEFHPAPSSYNTPYSPYNAARSQQGGQYPYPPAASRERRPVRFLRRSFGKNDQQPQQSPFRERQPKQTNQPNYDERQPDFNRITQPEYD